MGRILLLILLLIISIAIIKAMKRRLAQQKSKPLPKENKKKDMLKCQHCAVHIPEDQAIRQGDKVYCSLEHAQYYI